MGIDMNTGTRLAACALIVSGFGSGGAFGQDTIRISGRFVDADKNPMRDKTVRLKITGQGEIAATKTDDNGRFAFATAPPDQHYDLVLAGVPGLKPLTTAIQIQVVKSDVDLQDVVIQAPWRVGISGKLISFTGEPVSKANIVLTTSDPYQERSVFTNMDGTFDFFTLDAYKHYVVKIAVPALSPTVFDVYAEENDVKIGTVILQPLNSKVFEAALTALRVADGLASRAIVVSGRISDENDAPFAGARLCIVKVLPGNRLATGILKTKQDGSFAFPVVRLNEYEVHAIGSGGTDRTIWKIVPGGGANLSLGEIKVQVSSRQVLSTLIGPVATTGHSPLQPGPTTVAAMFIGPHAAVKIVLSDGEVVMVPREDKQVDCVRPVISPDQRTVGWLVDTPFCCTSYPISLTLVVYRPGMPLRRFHGDGRAIFDWKFVAGGKQAAFYQDFLHGTPGAHHELRDVETGRLVDKWDGELTPRASKWTQGMR